MFNFKFFLIGSLILITTPIILIQSHLAMENIAVLPFVFFWLLMLSKNKNPICSFLAGVSLGIGIYSYLGMRIIVPVLSLITLVYFKRNFKQSLRFLLGVLPFFILLYIANLRYPGAVVGNFNSPIPSINDFAVRYLSVFDLSFLFLKGDATAYHSTGKAGMFLISTLPLFLAGIWKILRQKKPFEILVLASFFLSPILFGFVPDIYRASRLLVLIPFYVIISTVGFLAIPKKIGAFIIVLIVISYLFFVNDYWFSYPKRVEKVFPLTIDYYNEEFIKIKN